MRKTFRNSLFVLLAALFLTQGCLTSDNRIKVPAPAPSPELGNELEETAEYLEAGIRQVYGVKHTAVIVFGRLAIIGISFESSDKIRNEKIKGSVIEFSQSHPNINQALATSEPDVVARIEEVAAEVKNGRPITDFLDEIGEILNRLK